jgi:hypothetical protein
VFARSTFKSLQDVLVQEIALLLNYKGLPSYLEALDITRDSEVLVSPIMVVLEVGAS